MDNRQFAALANALTSIPTRRHVLHGLGLALGASWLPDTAAAKKRKKKKATLCLDGQTVQASGEKRKKLLKRGAISGACLAPPPPPPPGAPNAYGCLSVDVACTSAAECCTGVCEDGICRAHGTGTCQQDRDGMCHTDNQLGALCNNSATCACYETTGASKFCADFSPQSALDCADCTKDADCLALGFPAGSACVPFNSGNCAGLCASGMFCMPPCAA